MSASSMGPATDETGSHEEDQFAFRFVARVVRDLVGTETASVFVYDPTADKVWLKYGTALSEREIEVPKHGSFVGHVIEAGKRLVVQDAAYLQGVHRSTDVTTHFVTHDLACVPIWSRHHNRVIGAIQAVNKKGPVVYSENDLRLMEDAASMLSAHVERAFLTQKVFEAASLMGISVR